jgi:hypothetical protein
MTPRPRRAVREVGDPQLVGAGGGEVPFHQVRGADRRRVSVGGEALLLPARTVDALVAHQPGDPVPAEVEAGLASGLGQLATAVDRVVFHPDHLDRRSHLRVADLAGTRRSRLGRPVGGGGDLQHVADRLDPSSKPTEHVRPVSVDEGDYLSDLVGGQRRRYRFVRPSRSVAKKPIQPSKCRWHDEAHGFLSRARRSAARPRSRCPAGSPSQPRPGSPTAATTPHPRRDPSPHARSPHGLTRLATNLLDHPDRPLTELVRVLLPLTPRTTCGCHAPSSFPRSRAPADPRPNQSANHGDVLEAVDPLHPLRRRILDGTVALASRSMAARLSR